MRVCYQELPTSETVAHELRKVGVKQERRRTDDVDTGVSHEYGNRGRGQVLMNEFSYQYENDIHSR
jgi:hypothetical protein